MSLMVCPECEHEWDQNVDHFEIITCSNCKNDLIARAEEQVSVPWTGEFRLELIDKE